MKFAATTVFLFLLCSNPGRIGVTGAQAQSGSATTPEQEQALTQQMLLQMGSRMGLDPEVLRNATPEQQREMLRQGGSAMADQMMQQMGAQMGLDPEAMRNATPDEQENMIRDGGKAMRGNMLGQIEQMFGMSIEEMQNLSEDDKAAMQARMMARAQAGQTPSPEDDPLPMRNAPRNGFPDGSIPLPVAADYTTDLAVNEPAGREMLFVAADTRRHEIVWRETRTAPFEQHLELLDITSDPSALVFELIDPNTRRVIRRYRPVAAAE
jgi:hypothetical protein